MDLFISNQTYSVCHFLKLGVDVEHSVSLNKSISEMHLVHPLSVNYGSEDEVVGIEGRCRSAVVLTYLNIKG